MMNKEVVSGPLLAMLLPTLCSFSDGHFLHSLKAASHLAHTIPDGEGGQTSLITQTHAMEVRLVSSEWPFLKQICGWGTEEEDMADLGGGHRPQAWS